MSSTSSVTAPPMPPRAAPSPVVCYPVETLPQPDMALYGAARERLDDRSPRSIVPPRDARAFGVPAGHFFRIAQHRGPAGRRPQPVERARPLRALLHRQDPRAARHARHHRRPAVEHACRTCGRWRPSPTTRSTGTASTQDGGGVHDVIGTRCDPYTNRLLSGGEYHHCCHSNLTPRARGRDAACRSREAEPHVHDVLNVFMCTGFTRDTAPVLHEGEPGAAGRLHRVLRRDRPARRRCRPAPAATAAPSTRATSPPAIRSRSRFFGPTWIC